METKRKLLDFVCAFLVFAIILLSIATLTGESFFDGAVGWDGEEAVLSLFGTRFEFDKNVIPMLCVVADFNDEIFVGGFSDVLKKTGNFFAQYVSDGISLFYHISKVAVGAE